MGEDKETSGTVIMLSDKQCKQLIKYASSPWLNIDKIGIINNEGIQLVVGYIDWVGKIHRIII